MARALKRTVAWGFVAVLALGVAGCASTGRPLGADPFSGGGGSGGSGAREIQVEVRNNNFNQANITARGQAIQRRLGRVSGNDQGRFTLQWTGGLLYFEVELLGGGGCVTSQVSVEAGQTVRVVVDATARMRRSGYSSLCDIESVR